MGNIKNSGKKRKKCQIMKKIIVITIVFQVCRPHIHHLVYWYACDTRFGPLRYGSYRKLETGKNNGYAISYRIRIGYDTRIVQLCTQALMFWIGASRWIIGGKTISSGFMSNYHKWVKDYEDQPRPRPDSRTNVQQMKEWRGPCKFMTTATPTEEECAYLW